MNKKTLANMFGIDTHEKDVEKLNHEKHSLACQVAHLQVKCEQIQNELDFYKMPQEEQIRLLMADVEEVERLYKERIAECEKVKALAQKNIDLYEERQKKLDEEVQRAYSRGMNDGRFTAYSEVGIWRLEADALVMDKQGNVFELLQGLEDVKSDASEPLADDEIVIDDLEGVV